ncbi:MAG: efflux RND transporter periplasmic adaptor subunit, partial [Planctomycetales bacterium]|nr:efflux RND transporter periplasmic adaptor subunit [Planctomycetales bacterium]
HAQVTISFTEPKQTIEVSAAEFGLIQRVEVREGESVKANQLLGELENRVLLEARRLAKQRAESTARIDSARADLKLKQTHYDKLSPLLKEGHANASEIERAKSEYDRAVAAFRLSEEESAEAEIELAKINAQLAQRQIRSPIDGTVIEIHRRPGEYLSNIDPKLATIVQLDELRVRFFPSTDSASRLKKGDKLPLRIENINHDVTGIVEFVSPITDSQSGTVRVDLLIDNSKREYRSGMKSEIVTSVLQTRKDEP